MAKTETLLRAYGWGEVCIGPLLHLVREGEPWEFPAHEVEEALTRGWERIPRSKKDTAAQAAPAPPEEANDASTG